MKFYQIDSFEKAFQVNFCNKKLFLLISSDDFERKSLLEKMAKKLPHQSAYSIFHYSSSQSIEEVIASMTSLALFGGPPVVVLDEVEERKKKEIDVLLEFLRSQSLAGFLILGAKNKKNIFSLVNFFDNNGVILDLTTEKVWEKEKRYFSMLKQKCQKENKVISDKAIYLLIKKVGLEAAFLENEMEKVITYIGDSKDITEKDVATVCLSSFQYSLWQLADKIVWKQEFDFTISHMEASFFHGLISFLRLQLQQGLKMISLIDKKTKEEDFMKFFPKLFPSQLQKRKQIAISFGERWFKKALITLYEIDLCSKNNVDNLPLLWDLFCTKIRRKDKS